MIILGTNSIKDTGGFNVANSVRMNRGSSDYFRRTNNTAGTSDKIGTYSGWVKRSTTTLDGMFFEGKDLAASNYTQIYFQGSGALTIYSSGGMDLVTTSLYRDPSAWYHVCVAFDTTQGTAANRVKLYVNGTQVTSFATETYPSQNSTIYFGVNGDQQAIGIREDGALLWNGYMAEICYVDGQALAQTDFGEFDGDSGIWKPKNVSGLTFGNNGCYLDFQDASNLGNVVAGNSTDFTENGLTSIDQSTDTCTNNSSNINALSIGDGVTLSEGNLQVLMDASAQFGGHSTIGVSTGKWYCEIKYSARTDADRLMLGISGNPNLLAYASPFGSGAGYVGGAQEPTSYGYYSDGGNSFNNDNSSSYGASYTVGDIIGIALDLDNNKLYFSKNGTFQNSGNPTSGSTGTGAISIGAASGTNTGNYFFAVSESSGSYGHTTQCNFGSPPYAISSGNTDGNGYGNFEYAVPSGYYSLNTKNLSEFG